MKSMYNTCLNNVLMKVGDLSGTKPNDAINSENHTLPIGVTQIYPTIVYSSQVISSFSRLEMARKGVLKGSQGFSRNGYSLESERRMIKFVASNSQIELP